MISESLAAQSMIDLSSATAGSGLAASWAIVATANANAAANDATKKRGGTIRALGMGRAPGWTKRGEQILFTNRVGSRKRNPPTCTTIAGRNRKRRMFGPLFGKELLEMARRRRFFVVRVLIGSLLLAGWWIGLGGRSPTIEFKNIGELSAIGEALFRGWAT